MTRSHQYAEEDLSLPLLKSQGSGYFRRMESSQSRGKVMVKSSYEIVVNNYFRRCKGMGVGKMIESAPFTAGGLRWTIAFFPDGNDEHAHNRGHVSLFLRLTSRNLTRRGADFVCSFTVLDQSNPDWRLGEFYGRRTYGHFNTLRPGQMWGFPMFMTRAAFESRDNNFVRGDCIKIRADLGVFVHYQKLPLPPCDRYVFFEVGGKQFYAEESVLAIRCPILLHYAIPEMERNVFEAILWFIYKGKLCRQDMKDISNSRSNDPNSFALKMLEAVDHFDLKVLRHIILELSSSMTIHRYMYDALKKQWRRFMSSRRYRC